MSCSLQASVVSKAVADTGRLDAGASPWSAEAVLEAIWDRCGGSVRKLSTIFNRAGTGQVSKADFERGLRLLGVDCEQLDGCSGVDDVFGLFDRSRRGSLALSELAKPPKRAGHGGASAKGLPAPHSTALHAPGCVQRARQRIPPALSRNGSPGSASFGQALGHVASGSTASAEGSMATKASSSSAPAPPLPPGSGCGGAVKAGVAAGACPGTCRTGGNEAQAGFAGAGGESRGSATATAASPKVKGVRPSNPAPKSRQPLRLERAEKVVTEDVADTGYVSDLRKMLKERDDEVAALRRELDEFEAQQEERARRNNLAAIQSLSIKHREFQEAICEHRQEQHAATAASQIQEAGARPMGYVKALAAQHRAREEARRLAEQDAECLLELTAVLRESREHSLAVAERGHEETLKTVQGNMELEAQREAIDRRTEELSQSVDALRKETFLDSVKEEEEEALSRERLRNELEQVQRQLEAEREVAGRFEETWRIVREEQDELRAWSKECEQAQEAHRAACLLAKAETQQVLGEAADERVLAETTAAMEEEELAQLHAKSECCAEEIAARYDEEAEALEAENEELRLLLPEVRPGRTESLRRFRPALSAGGAAGGAAACEAPRAGSKRRARPLTKSPSEVAACDAKGSAWVSGRGTPVSGSGGRSSGELRRQRRNSPPSASNPGVAAAVAGAPASAATGSRVPRPSSPVLKRAALGTKATLRQEQSPGHRRPSPAQVEDAAAHRHTPTRRRALDVMPLHEEDLPVEKLHLSKWCPRAVARRSTESLQEAPAASPEPDAEPEQELPLLEVQAKLEADFDIQPSALCSPPTMPATPPSIRISSPMSSPPTMPSTTGSLRTRVRPPLMEESSQAVSKSTSHLHDLLLCSGSGDLGIPAASPLEGKQGTSPPPPPPPPPASFGFRAVAPPAVKPLILGDTPSDGGSPKSAAAQSHSPPADAGAAVAIAVAMAASGRLSPPRSGQHLRIPLAFEPGVRTPPAPPAMGDGVASTHGQVAAWAKWEGGVASSSSAAW